MVATHKDQEKWNEGCCSHPTPSPSSDIDNDENGANMGAATTLMASATLPSCHPLAEH